MSYMQAGTEMSEIMSGQLHITHRSEYERGRAQGSQDVLTGETYRSGGGATGTEGQQNAYKLGYVDGWAENNPCENCTCDHRAHQEA